MSNINETSSVRIITAIRKLAEGYPRNISDHLLYRYAERFENYKPEIIENACELALDESKYFPSIAELLEFVRQKVAQNRQVKEEKIQAEIKNVFSPKEHGTIFKTINEALGVDTKKLNLLLEKLKSVQLNVCTTCSARGIAYATKATEEGLDYTYVFKCFCPVGKERVEAWPVWSGQFRQAGFRLKEV